MKILRLIPFLPALILSGCTFYLERPAKKERIEVSEIIIDKTAKGQPVNQDSIIYQVVEIPASYPGGDEALFEYLGQNLKYPLPAVEAKIQGTVFVQFVVEKNGSISDVRIMQSTVGGGCEEAAMEVVRKMPKWNPGTQRGKPVRTIFILPVQFKL